MTEDKRTLSTRELLLAVQYALNTIPRKSLRGCPGGFKDSYALAAQVDAALAEMVEG